MCQRCQLRSLELEPENPAALSTLYELAEKLDGAGDRAAAERVLTAWRRHKGEDSEHLYQNQLGNWQYSAEDYAAAVACYGRAVRAKPDDPKLAVFANRQAASPPPTVTWRTIDPSLALVDRRRRELSTRHSLAAEAWSTADTDTATSSPSMTAKSSGLHEQIGSPWVSGVAGVMASYARPLVSGRPLAATLPRGHVPRWPWRPVVDTRPRAENNNPHRK